MKVTAQFQDSVYDEQKRRLAEQVARSDTSARPGTTKTAASPNVAPTDRRIKLRVRKNT